MIILGLNAFHGDSSACLFVDGKMVAAAEEERFRRIKHWAGFPSMAVEFCLQQSKLKVKDIDVVAINTDSKAARSKKLEYILSGQASLALIKEKLSIRKKRGGVEECFANSFPNDKLAARIEYVEHHLAHLASAYLVSPFSNASIISVDGFGDFASSATAFGQGSAIEIEQRVYFPHSLGVFYQALTQYLGFPHYGDEYKVMGLAPYGEPRYRHEMSDIVNLVDDGMFQLNLKYFKHHKHPIAYQWEDNAPKVGALFSEQLKDLLIKKREPHEPLKQQHFDLARSIQDKYEGAFFHMLNNMHAHHAVDNLCIAGGCGMNSVANGKVHLHTSYKNIYVQSAAGDAGGAVGAAAVAHQRLQYGQRFTMQHAYWGPQFSDQETKRILKSYASDLKQTHYEVHFDTNFDDLTSLVSESIADGKVVGWFQGAMEWGPRALGNRSILADPRRQDMKDILNLKIKRRESFRPFAPSVLRNEVANWFESDADVPFMMKVFQVKKTMRNQIPAVTHIDGSGRLQTVSQVSNPRYYALIKKFFELTGVPMLLNTSFNENEPMVCRPEEAIDCFLRTKMDILVLGSHFILRTK